MIKRLLIANRGEIARRIIRTCRELGVESVAVYSEIDADLPHVREADRAVCLGGAVASESYLDIGKVIAAAQDTGADAIHPGYGFLSENAAFADACEQANIRFVGPRKNAIAVMGDKAAARRLMTEHGVPVLPGFDDEHASDEDLLNAAARVGFPLLIKAVAGGGGKGMRIVEREADFAEALASARREARNAFADDRVLLERYLPSARHVEVQVFADEHGNTVHLFERDCSVQRRHQKIIEEAPAPGIGQQLRDALGQAAVQAARAINYVGAGTIEFLLAPDGEFFFMEMNTRLQVEHPVTELITGEDLVHWQLLVASGESLPRTQDQLCISGHAMEVRIYAEDPWQGFLPSSGTLSLAHWPHDRARVDTGFETGNTVSAHYDPMIAKIICHAPDRDTARRQLIAALCDTDIAGVSVNVAFLLGVLQDEAFASAQLDTRLLEHRPHLLEAPAAIPPAALVAAAHLIAHRGGKDVWDTLSGWRPFGAQLCQARLGTPEGIVTVTLFQTENGPRASVDDTEASVDIRAEGQHLHCHWNDSSWQGRIRDHGHSLDLFSRGTHLHLRVDPSHGTADEASRHGGYTAPMSGSIVALHVAAGDPVSQGAALLTMEAMKMEHTIRAGADGRVSAFLVAAGESVKDGQALLEFDADGEDDNRD